MSNTPSRKSNRKIKLNSKYKDTIQNKKNKNNDNDPEFIYCTECNMIIDNDILEHYIFDGRDVCDLCYNELSKPPSNTNSSNINSSNTNSLFTNPSNINFFSNPPIVPITPIIPITPGIPATPSFKFSLAPQPTQHKPFQNGNNPNKIRLIFFNNTPDTNKDSTKKPGEEKQSIMTETNNKKHKNNNNNKSNNNNCTTRKDNEDGDADGDADGDENGYVDGNNDNIGNLFLQSLLNRLHNCEPDNTNTTNNNADNENENETEKELENNSNQPVEYEWLGSNIKNIDDLIELGKSYHSRKRKRHNLNLKLLNRLVEPLTELKNMIGMQDVKKIVFDQIIYYLQQLDDKNVDMLHTVIVGPPGVGKTQLTYIIAKIYNRLGFLKTDKVICAKRDDLIGEFIGQTAPKTRKVLERALGGVLLLDEIYSLSPTSDRDFAKEAIDMINMYLSEHAHDLVCVVAGYKKPTYEKFFSQNEGLARRFTHHFEIKGYTPEELGLIFKKYLEEQKWFLSSSMDELTPIIKENMEIFPNFGGDMTTLFACCKKTHSRRLLDIPTEEELENTKKKIMLPDIITGIKLFRDIKTKHSSSDEEDKGKYMHMYS